MEYARHKERDGAREREGRGYCSAETQQYALIGLSSSLHSEACNAFGEREREGRGYCWAEIQQFALIGLSSSLHSEACNAFGALCGVIHSSISESWAEIQQFALIGLSSSLHSEACNALPQQLRAGRRPPLSGLRGRGAGLRHLPVPGGSRVPRCFPVAITFRLACGSPPRPSAAVTFRLACGSPH
jgi:hypothetical protein